MQLFGYKVFTKSEYIPEQSGKICDYYNMPDIPIWKWSMHFIQ